MSYHLISCNFPSIYYNNYQNPLSNLLILIVTLGFQDFWDVCLCLFHLSHFLFHVINLLCCKWTINTTRLSVAMLGLYGFTFCNHGTWILLRVVGMSSSWFVVIREVSWFSGVDLCVIVYAYFNSWNSGDYGKLWCMWHWYFITCLLCRVEIVHCCIL